MCEERFTSAPPVGAGPFKVTVPVDVEPPKTILGEIETPVSVAGWIVREDVKVTPP